MSLQSSSLSAALDRLSLCLLHFLWQGCLIALVLALLLRLCRRGTPELRGMLCSLGLAAMTAAPILTWKSILPPALPAAQTQADAEPADNVIRTGSVLSLEDSEPQPAVAPAERLPRRQISVIAEGRADPTSPSVAASAPRWLAWAWICGAGLLGLWRLAGLAGLRRLLRQTTEAAQPLKQLAGTIARRCGLKSAPVLRITAQLTSPAVAGVLRPVLLLPAAAISGLSPRELEFVLAHELTHIRRRDFLAGLLQTLVETVLFFHPAVWWASRRLTLEREHACDDAAAGVTGDRRACASALAWLGEMQLAHQRMAQAASGGQLLTRVRRLLDPSPRRSGSGLLVTVPLAAAAALVLILTSQDSVSQEDSAAVSRGSITDRNGVVLAESAPGTWIRNGKTWSGERRRYPLGSLAAHLVGWTSQGKGETGPDEGRSGVEQGMDETLMSVPQAEGKPQTAVELTIDARLQTICEEALAAAGVGRGSVVLIDPRNGDVLSAASVPSFDPNDLVPFVTEEKGRRYFTDGAEYDPTVPLLNRAMTSSTPGSTFKLITALAEIEAGAGTFECTGSVQMGARIFSCWTRQKGLAGHGNMDVRSAIQRSCNCYFFQAGNHAGMERLEKMAALFGIGEPSGTVLDGSDHSPVRQGLMPTRESPGGTRSGEKWTPARTANISIGQGEVLTTPLQMARLAAAIGNGGKIWQHRIVNRSLVNGRWESTPAVLLHDLVPGICSAEALQPLRGGMSDAVNATGGTAPRARSSIITIAGKTGTAQMFRNDAATKKRVPDNHAQFVGFAPFDQPRFAISVVVANGEAGGSVCAPIARRILEQAALLEQGKLTIEVKPRKPAAGHFGPLREVSYPEASEPAQPD